MNDRYESFAIRLWVTGRGIAHGEIVRAADGAKSRLRNLGEIAEVIERCVSSGNATPMSNGHGSGDRTAAGSPEPDRERDSGA